MVDYEKINWTKTLSKLGKDVIIAERTLGHFLDEDEFAKDRRDLLRFREEYLAKTQKRLQSFKAALGPIKERLEDICAGRAGADVIQPLLESYEKKLTDFKILMRDEFVELENEEVVLTRELHVVASRMEGWMAAADGGPRPDEVERLAEVKGRKEASERRLNDELERQAKIGAIDKQLVILGGRTGGWDSRDHDAFIRVWTQVGCAPAVRPPPQITNHLATAASSSSSSSQSGNRSPPKSPQRIGMAVVGNALRGGGVRSSGNGCSSGPGDDGHDRDINAASPGDGGPERQQQAHTHTQAGPKPLARARWHFPQRARQGAIVAAPPTPPHSPDQRSQPSRHTKARCTCACPSYQEARATADAPLPPAACVARKNQHPFARSPDRHTPHSSCSSAPCSCYPDS